MLSSSFSCLGLCENVIDQIKVTVVKSLDTSESSKAMDVDIFCSMWDHINRHLLSFTCGCISNMECGLSTGQKLCSDEGMKRYSTLNSCIRFYIAKMSRTIRVFPHKYTKLAMLALLPTLYTHTCAVCCFIGT